MKITVLFRAVLLPFFAFLLALPSFSQGRERTRTATYDMQNAQGTVDRGSPRRYSTEGARTYFSNPNFAYAREFLPPDIQKAEGLGTSGQESTPYPSRQTGVQQVRWSLFYSPSTRSHYKVGSGHGTFDGGQLSGVVYIKKERSPGSQDYATVKEWGVTSGQFYALDSGQNVRIAKEGGELCAGKVGNARVACEQSVKNDRIDGAGANQPKAIAMRDCSRTSGLERFACDAANALAAGASPK